MNYCKVRCSLCSVQQAWWSLHWVLRPGWAEVVCGGVAVLPNAGRFQMWGCCSATTAYRTLPLNEWPALDILWGTARSSRASAVCSWCEGPCTGCCGRAGQVWFVGGAVLLNAGVFQMWRHHPATTAHRALSVCEWPALDMPWATARQNGASAVCSRCGGPFTGCYSRTG